MSSFNAPSIGMINQKHKELLENGSVSMKFSEGAPILKSLLDHQGHVFSVEGGLAPGQSQEEDIVTFKLI